jgi:hypothetical protein
MVKTGGEALSRTGKNEKETRTRRKRQREKQGVSFHGLAEGGVSVLELFDSKEDTNGEHQNATVRQRLVIEFLEAGTRHH